MAGVGRLGAIAAVSRHMRGQQTQRRSRNLIVDGLFARFDTDHSGFLDRRQLKKLLVSLNGGQSVTDSELQFVLYSGDKTDGHIDNQLSKSELESALAAWKTIKEHKAELDVIYKKYDTNKTGRLEEQQLARLLADLDNGVPPNPEEVRLVLHQADKSDGVLNGGVDPAELTTALTVWNNHHSFHHTRRRRKGDPCRCVIM
eukprot:TRINITY_DN54517_c0_g2_i1.p2 TRINITY_DN54517_c0_g2~~TRINITY_DN54517_c0_g2_i1.p2  ORF type:complete len:201 (+),score=40.42 TRINITY_DN54517_c0_g2_i1:82-684(+)